MKGLSLDTGHYCKGMCFGIISAHRRILIIWTTERTCWVSIKVYLMGTDTDNHIFREVMHNISYNDNAALYRSKIKPKAHAQETEILDPTITTIPTCAGA